MKKEVISIQDLISSSLAESKFLLSNKKGYRTYTINSQELSKKMSMLRIMLDSVGIKKGDSVIILGYNSIEWIVVYFSCILSGIVAVPLDVMTDKKLLHKIDIQVKSKAIFQSKNLNLKAARNKKHFFLEDLDDYFSKIKLREIPINKVDPGDVFEIQYTSGTTGDPKGVILTHENIVTSVKTAVSTIKIGFPLRFLNILPLSHVFSQIMGIFLPLYFHYHVFFIDNLQPKKLISFIRNKDINIAIFVPGILSAIKKDLEGKCTNCSLGLQFRIIGVGGASLDVQLEKWWRRRLIILLQGYGMTETASVIAVNAPFATRIGSVGKIAECVDVRIGSDNEILVRGKNITPGYYKNESKTRESFEYGWFKTGDIGEIKKGYLYIKERKKDIIITPSGLKAYPVDIEPILDSMREVKESCVIEKDKRIHAILILKERAEPGELIKRANTKLLDHEKIATFSVWNEASFPRTSTGKIKRFIVQQSLLNDKSPKKAYYQNKIYEVIHDVLKPTRKVISHAKLSDLGMDSLKRIELISELEKAYGVEIDEVEINQNTTTSDLEKIINEKGVHSIKFRKWPTNSLVTMLRNFYHKIFLFPLIRIFTKTEYFGIENIKGINEQVVFVSNHQSALDMPLIIKPLKGKFAAAADSGVVFGIGTKRLPERLLRKVLGYYSAFTFNAYPFGSSIGTDKSLDFTGEMIDRGHSIILFPEGERTRDGKIHAFKSGIGYIVMNMKIPVVPVKIEGLFEILPVGHSIPKFGHTKVTFGRRIIIDAKTASKMSYAEISKLIEDKVREL